MCALHVALSPVCLKCVLCLIKALLHVSCLACLLFVWSSGFRPNPMLSCVLLDIPGVRFMYLAFVFLGTHSRRLLCCCFTHLISLEHWYHTSCHHNHRITVTVGPSCPPCLAPRCLRRSVALALGSGSPKTPEAGHPGRRDVQAGLVVGAGGKPTRW